MARARNIKPAFFENEVLTDKYAKLINEDMSCLGYC